MVCRITQSPFERERERDIADINRDHICRPSATGSILSANWTIERNYTPKKSRNESENRVCLSSQIADASDTSQKYELSYILEHLLLFGAAPLMLQPSLCSKKGE